MSKDPLVESALKNWAPRFMANGIEYSDFVRTMDKIERWDEWFDRWSETAYVHEELAAQAKADGHVLSAAAHYVTASVTYHFAKFLYVHDRERLRRGSDQTASCYAQAMALWPVPGERLIIPFDGAAIIANLRKPACAFSGIVLIVPGLDSVKEEMHNLENLFLERGLATVSVDGPGQGESEFTLPIYPDYERVISAVIDNLQQRADFKKAPIGLVGISLGGYYACRGAAFEKRVAACAPVGGPYDLGDCWVGLPNLTKTAFMIRSGARDMDEAGQKARLLTLKECQGLIHCPLLVIHGHLDRLFPIEQVRQIYREAAGEKYILELEDGNHVCNNVPYKYRPRLADWMKKVLNI